MPVITLCLALATVAPTSWCDPPEVISLEGPRQLEIDLNGDGVGDFVFANYTNTGSYRGSHFSYSINVRDRRNTDWLHSVHVYHDGYTDSRSEGRRVVTTGGGLPECAYRAHFLVRNDDDRMYELLTAKRLTDKYPTPRLGTVEFTFHRLRTPEYVGTAAYIYDGYRKTKSKAQYCDVAEAVRKEVFGERSEAEGVLGSQGEGSPPVDDD
ncbi:MAG: hypothetical protein OXK76_03725 [Gammaproteobacteria bacterium]|nr:hypothetical protein [Gammaproteobacteria bacterium]